VTWIIYVVIGSGFVEWDIEEVISLRNYIDFREDASFFSALFLLRSSFAMIP